mmetsp:Transcript_3922/g.11351  ORF Transcript_3922/g.11351 Transcript_3922/m.11351 type:complete len:571 (-) Transcript_3922:581-2293(-)
MVPGDRDSIAEDPVLDAPGLQLRLQVREEHAYPRLTVVVLPSRLSHIVGLLERDVTVRPDPEARVLDPKQFHLLPSLPNDINVRSRVVLEIELCPIARLDALGQRLALHEAGGISVFREHLVTDCLVLQVKSTLRGKHLGSVGRSRALWPLATVPLLLQYARVPPAPLPLLDVSPPLLKPGTARVSGTAVPLQPRAWDAVPDLRAGQVGDVQEPARGAFGVPANLDGAGSFHQSPPDLSRGIRGMILQVEGDGAKDMGTRHAGAAGKARVVVLSVPGAHDVSPGGKDVHAAAVVGEARDVVAPVGGRHRDRGRNAGGREPASVLVAVPRGDDDGDPGIYQGLDCPVDGPALVSPQRKNGRRGLLVIHGDPIQPLDNAAPGPRSIAPEDSHRVNDGVLGHPKLPAGRGSSDVSPVTVLVPGIPVPVDNVDAVCDPSREVDVRVADSRVQDVQMDPLPGRGDVEGPVQGQVALVDPVETPQPAADLLHPHPRAHGAGQGVHGVALHLPLDELELVPQHLPAPHQLLLALGPEEHDPVETAGGRVPTLAAAIQSFVWPLQTIADPLHLLQPDL